MPGLRRAQRRKCLAATAAALIGALLSSAGCDRAPPAQGGPLRFEEAASRLGIARTGPSYAAAAADFDRDGWVDLAVSEHQRVTLQRNDQGRRFVELPAERFSQSGDTHGVTWLDWNGDGWPDLYVSRGAFRGRGERSNRLHVNRGGRAFETAEVPDVLDNARGRGRSATPWDLNGDGRLDLMILNFHDEGRPQRLALSAPGGYRDAARETGWHDLRANTVTAFRLGGEAAFVLSGNGRDAGRILRRNEAGRFVDVTARVGIALDPGMAVTAVAVGDADNDGDDDLYYVRAAGDAQGATVEDGVLSFFYARRHRADEAGFTVRPEGPFELEVWAEGRLEHDFLYVGPEARVADVPVVRVDAPGDFPAGAPNLEAARAGAYFWKTTDGAFEFRYVGGGSRPAAVSGTLAIDAGGVGLVRQLGARDLDARAPNQLFINNEGVFREVEAAADAAGGHDARFVDFDNDGDLDLYVVNGAHKLRNEPNRLYENRGGLDFADVAREAGVSGSARGRGATATVLDFDNDGRMDIFLGNGEGPPPWNREGPQEFFLNRSPAGNWLKVRLEPSRSNPMALGTTVTVSTEAGEQQRFVNAASGALATDWTPLHFGLGDAESASVSVRWPSGAAREQRVRANEIVTLKEPAKGEGK